MRGANYLAGATVAAVVTALGIGIVHRRAHISLDTTIGVLFTGAFALGVFLMSRSSRATVDLQSYLFGNILGVGPADLLLVVGLGVLVAIVVGALWRPLLYTSFDPVVAEAAGIKARFVEDALLVVVALTIIVSLPLVGIVLVAALVVTPAAAAAQLTRRFVPMLLLSAAFGVFSCVGGLYASYWLKSASGATIVLLATLVFFVALAARRLSAQHRAPVGRWIRLGRIRQRRAATAALSLSVPMPVTASKPWVTVQPSGCWSAQPARTAAAWAGCRL